MRAWIRSGEAAEMLDVPARTFARMIKRERLTEQVIHTKVGREVRWSPESLWRWHLERQPSLDRAECVAFCAEFPIPTPDRTPQVVDSNRSPNQPKPKEQQ